MTSAMESLIRLREKALVADEIEDPTAWTLVRDAVKELECLRSELAEACRLNIPAIQDMRGEVLRLHTEIDLLLTIPNGFRQISGELFGQQDLFDVDPSQWLRSVHSRMSESEFEAMGLRARVAELEADGKRLDWLETYHDNKIESSVVHRYFRRHFRGGTKAWTLREAIDKTMGDE